MAVQPIINYSRALTSAVQTAAKSIDPYGRSLTQGLKTSRNAINQTMKPCSDRANDTIRSIQQSLLNREPRTAEASTDSRIRQNLDNWVNEAPNERGIRQRVKKQIKIVNGRLVVNGELDLINTNISSLPQGLHVGVDLDLSGCTSLTELPQGLHVGGDLDLDGCTRLRTLPQGLTVERDLWLNGCTSLTTLPENLHVGGDLYLFKCTNLTELPDWVFNVSDLKYVPDHLQQTNTYKTFQILKHFDTHNTISDINNQELINLYNNNQDRINLLKYNRHCFRIAHALCNNDPLTPQQQVFKDNANEHDLVRMVMSFRPDIFKNLPGINNTLPINIDSDNNSGIGILPFVANFRFLSASETQGLRMVCKSFNERVILDQTRIFSLENILQILQD